MTVLNTINGGRINIMNSEQTYELEVTTTVNLSINFEDVYKLVSEDIKTNDAWKIQCDFGDNMECYLDKLYGDKLANVTLDDWISDTIFNDFYKYLEEHYGYEND